jgi:histone deacetylase complex regulatory component SIN3
MVAEEAQGKLQEALEFIGQVEARYHEKPEVYQSFLRILGDFHRER